MPPAHDDETGTRGQGGTPRSAGTRLTAGMPARRSIVAETVFRPPAAAGRTYRILRTAELDPYDPPVAPATIPPFGAPSAAPPGDRFRGTARKAAKLSIAGAPIQAFADLPGLIASLTPDHLMRSHDPPIDDDAGSDRVSEEERNVRVRALLYAASRENDNDFHLIIGNARSPGPLRCMTMELSGLPPSSSRSYRRLKRTRGAYKAFFGADLPGSSYDFYDPPIPVEIEGSLFFDITHATGSRPGPASLRPSIPTIWEVHPITKIVFEP